MSKTDFLSINSYIQCGTSVKTTKHTLSLTRFLNMENLPTNMMTAQCRENLNGTVLPLTETKAPTPETPLLMLKIAMHF